MFSADECSSLSLNSNGDSFQVAQEKFDTPVVAARYPAGYKMDLKSIAERKTVIRMMDLFPPGGHILDCPSGTGRLVSILLSRGYQVTGADYSQHMIQNCRKNIEELNPGCESRTAYAVEDIGALKFADKMFDGVICNRLFHHYGEQETRVRVLTELARVSRGPVVISFNYFTLALHINRLTHRLQNRSFQTRAISIVQMSNEFANAGMQVVKVAPILRGFSRMCYIAAVPVSS